MICHFALKFVKIWLPEYRKYPNVQNLIKFSETIISFTLVGY